MAERQVFSIYNYHICNVSADIGALAFAQANLAKFALNSFYVC
jgi:hypothetical protein